MVEITYFVHGTTLDNEQHLSTGWAQGELSPLGVEQATELGFQVKDIHFDIVFCSDLKRAIDSATLAFLNQYPIIQDSRLREANYGDLNQHHEHEFNPDPHFYIENKFPNGESFHDVEARIVDFLHLMQTDYNDKRVAIVAHKAPQFALEVLINNKSWKQAIDEDWRKGKNWQPGWTYRIEE